MKNLMANMIKNKNAKVKAEASKNKKLAGEHKTTITQENIKQNIVVEKEVMKESKTLMLD